MYHYVDVPSAFDLPWENPFEEDIFNEVGKAEDGVDVDDPEGHAESMGATTEEEHIQYPPADVDDADDDEFFLTIVMCVAITTSCAALEFLQRREGVIQRQRCDWDVLCSTLALEEAFESTFTLGYSSFYRLLKMIKDSLVVDTAQSMRRTGLPPITPAEMLAITLRWLAGGSYKDIRLIFHVSISHFYAIKDRVILAICNVAQIQIRLPKSEQEIAEAVAGFKNMSSNGVFGGCRYAIDGWLCMIKCPGCNECLNPKDYFNGHYKCHGINVQVACDHQCR